MLSTLFIYRLLYWWMMIVLSWVMCHMCVLFMFSVILGARRICPFQTSWIECKWLNCAAATCSYLHFSSHSFSSECKMHSIVTNGVEHPENPWPRSHFICPYLLIRLKIYLFLQSVVSLFVVLGSSWNDLQRIRSISIIFVTYRLHYNEFLLQVLWINVKYLKKQ